MKTLIKILLDLYFAFHSDTCGLILYTQGDEHGYKISREEVD